MEAVVSQLSLYCSNAGLGIPFLPHPAHSFLPLALLVKLHKELHQGMGLAEVSHLPFFVVFFFFPAGSISGLVHHVAALTTRPAQWVGMSKLAALP